MGTDAPATRASRREWIGLAVLALPTLLVSVDISVLFLALPHLAADLGASNTQLLWITDIYAFMIAGFLVAMGTLGDRIGRRRILVIGGAVFGLASVLAAYSTTPEMLIGARALLGVAGATLAPSALALVTTMFTDPKQRGLAIGVFMSCFMGGGALGPVVGGFMLEYFWWGSVFLLAVPIMLLLVVAGPLLLPESRNPDAGSIDLLSVVMALGSILPVIYSLKELATGNTSPLVFASLLLGAVVTTLFIRRQRKLETPLVDLTLFTNTIFRSALLVMLLGSIVMSGMMMLFAMYLQMVVGLSPLQAGLWTVIPAVATVVGAMLAPAAAQRVSPGIVIAGGLLVSACGFLLMTQIGPLGGLAVTLAGIAVGSIGAGAFASLGTDLALGAAPPDRAGSAASLSETGGELGVALGIATLGTLGAAIYSSQLVIPAGVSSEAGEASRESIANATVEAAALPGQLAVDLMENAREAFSTGLGVTAATAVVLYLLLAVLAFVTLRRTPPTGSVVVEETPEAGSTEDGAEEPTLSAEPEPEQSKG
ncbi:MFS transporter [Nocardiopsis sp. B62]|uniref:MFS transporter n=1 Tax=Nocardiopsis sp. B62 TaxID=2824874 RepID=UPI001B39B2C0|nr:MFS transporter [Nocardiopsis sp. B62]MBQ1080615.1 MFS transporter [Nocardiopsis sp. B62]